MNNNQQMSLGDFLERAAPWVLLGGAAGLRGSGLGWWTLLGPIGEKVLGFTLEDALRDAAVAMEQERQERVRQLFQALAATAEVQTLPVPSSGNQVQVDKALVEADSKWLEVIIHPSVVLVLGKRGSGKSALGYRLLELFRYGPCAYVVGVPASARSLLPDWIGIAASLDNVPLKAIALVDEAYLHYHARGSMAQRSKAMSQLLNLSRQRQQTIIFVSQEARQVDRNIASSANVLVFKDLGMLQVQFDRPELNRLVAQAREAFAVVKGDRRRWSFVYSPDTDFHGVLENSLPTFWSSKLSQIFAIGREISAERPPKRMTREERVQKAKELHRGGLSYKDIAGVLKVDKSTAYNYVNDYPYKQ